MYANILQQIGEDEKELKKCLTSLHIDYFVYKSTLEQFAQLFDLLTQSNERIELLLNDTKTSRAFDSCLILCGDKVKLTSEENYEVNIDKFKAALDRLSEYFMANIENMLVTQSGVFALRSLLRIIGQPDPLDEQFNRSFAANAKKFQPQKQNEFSIKNVAPKLLPAEWKIRKLIKKLAKILNEINILGNILACMRLSNLL